MKEELDIAWAAGILEGEGSFIINTQKGRKTPSVRIKCEMTDHDIILRLRDVFAVGNIHTPKIRPGCKQSWALQIYKQSDIETVIHKVMPYLGIRRSAKAKELLAHIESRKKTNAG